MLLIFLSFLLIARCETVGLSTTKNTKLIAAVEMIMAKVNTENTVNVISDVGVKDSTVNDVKDALLLKLSNHSLLQNINGPPTSCNILLIDSFEGFLEIFSKMSFKMFPSSGLYLIVAANGEIPEIKNIFELLWQLYICNVNIIFENESGEIWVETFMPFTESNCNDISPVIVNKFYDGHFENQLDHLFVAKIKKLHNCSIRVAISESVSPAVIIAQFPNQSFYYSGRDITLIEALSASLNFFINYTFVGQEGYLYDNGSSEGPLRALKNGDSDLAISDCWLKPNRMKYFDSTTSYISQQLIFVIPPGREWSSLEKLIYPFAVSSWILLLCCFLIGFLVIIVIKTKSKAVQNFVFGTNVKNPYLNMLIGVIGSTQHTLPRRNFARFLLMMFLIYSLVVRTLYQGAFFQLMHSNKHQREFQSIDEMIAGEQTFFIFDSMFDLFEGSEKITNR